MLTMKRFKTNKLQHQFQKQHCCVWRVVGWWLRLRESRVRDLRVLAINADDEVANGKRAAGSESQEEFDAMCSI